MLTAKQIESAKAMPFNQDMVPLVMDGSKTQSRRPLKIEWQEGAALLGYPRKWEIPQATVWDNGNWHTWDSDSCGGENWKEDTVDEAKHQAILSAFKQGFIKLPYKVGQILWVRERARLICLNYGDTVDMGIFEYEADHKNSSFVRIPKRLKPIPVGNCCPNGCFKELARTFLEVTRVWIEQVKDIHHLDIQAEGIRGISMGHRKELFKDLWDSIYPNSWDRNDWTVCIEFKAHRAESRRRK